MKRYFITICFTFILGMILTSCTAGKKSTYLEGFWGEIQEDETFLYTRADTQSIAHADLKKGSVVFFYQKQGDYNTVYSTNPANLKTKKSISRSRYFLHKPNYTKSIGYSDTNAKLYKTPFDLNRSYLTGPRGGCYYINSKNNKTYVSRSICGESYKYKASKNQLSRQSNIPTKSRSSSCRTVQCSGTTKAGSRCRNKTTNCGGRCHLH